MVRFRIGMVETNYSYVLEPIIRKQNQYIIQNWVQKRTNHSPTKQLWTIQNLNMFYIQAHIVMD